MFMLTFGRLADAELKDEDLTGNVFQDRLYIDAVCLLQTSSSLYICITSEMPEYYYYYHHHSLYRIHVVIHHCVLVFVYKCI